MPKSAKILAENIQAALDQGIISKADLCRKAKLSRPTLDRYLAGVVPGFDTVDAIADAIGVSVAALMSPATSLQHLERPENIPAHIWTKLQRICHSAEWGLVELALDSAISAQEKDRPATKRKRA